MSDTNPSTIISFAMMVGSATYLLLAVMSMVYDRFKNPVRTDSYDGEYDSEGKFDGYGRLVITDGSAYEGQFSQGQYHGIGRYQSSEETTILSKFVHNTPVGFARKQLVGGAFLEGYFSTDRPHGFVYSRTSLGMPGLAVYSDGERKAWYSPANHVPKKQPLPCVDVF